MSAAGLVQGLAFSQRRTLVEQAVTSHLLPSTSFRMISERLTIRYLRALFSFSKAFDANSIDVPSSGLSGQSVGEFRSGVVETRECGIKPPWRERSADALSRRYCRGGPCGDGSAYVADVRFAGLH